MIHLAFIYKGTVVKRQSFDLRYTKNTKQMIRDWISYGEIQKPENWERYEITEEPLPDWVG